MYGNHHNSTDYQNCTNLTYTVNCTCVIVTFTCYLWRFRYETTLGDTYSLLKARYNLHTSIIMGEFTSPVIAVQNSWKILPSPPTSLQVYPLHNIVVQQVDIVSTCCIVIDIANLLLNNNDFHCTNLGPTIL